VGGEREEEGSAHKRLQYCVLNCNVHCTRYPAHCSILDTSLQPATNRSTLECHGEDKDLTARVLLEIALHQHRGLKDGVAHLGALENEGESAKPVPAHRTKEGQLSSRQQALASVIVPLPCLPWRNWMTCVRPTWRRVLVLVLSTVSRMASRWTRLPLRPVSIVPLPLGEPRDPGWSSCLCVAWNGPSCASHAGGGRQSSCLYDGYCCVQ
jgi:hypothetical protein